MAIAKSIKNRYNKYLCVLFKSKNHNSKHELHVQCPKNIDLYKFDKFDIIGMKFYILVSIERSILYFNISICSSLIL